MYTKLGILIFAATILLGPFYTVEGYSVIANTVSELGAQRTPNNLVAIIGFVAFGLGIAIEWLRHRSWVTAPFLLFGIFITAAGLLPHKPIDPEILYNVLVHRLHSVMASASGIAVTLGFLFQGVRESTTKMRIYDFYMAGICLTLPMAMFAMPELQGLIQRLMYFQVFIWLWFFYPTGSYSLANI
jgi:lysylphosphatidylglycerol synthetase-like protein (DUF2156 family)